MKKKRLTLLISAIVVVLLCAAAVVLIVTEPTDDADTSSSGTVAIIALDSQVESLDIVNENGSYTIVPDETAAADDNSSTEDSADSTTEDDRQWKIEDLTGISQYQSMYSDIVTLMTDLSADLALSSPGENSVYGLDQPAKATAYYADGSSLTLLVGDMTPDESGYYCKLADDDTIYVISSDNGAKFLRSILDYVDLTVTPTVETSAYTTVDSSGDDESAASETTLNVSEISIKISGKEEVIFTASDNELVRNGESIDEDLSSQLLSIISSITADSAAAVFPTDSQKEEFGFNSPTAVISYTVSGETYTLTVGNSIESTTDESQNVNVSAGIASYYVMVNGSDVIYVVGKDYLPWLNMDLG